MGVSFKVSKVGRRYHPRAHPQSSQSVSESGENQGDSSLPSERVPTKPEVNAPAKNVFTGASVFSSKGPQISPEHEVSFTINLLPDGFFIGKPNEPATLQNHFQDGRSLLHPYNRASESLFCAIESGWLPGDVFDDIPCKYINGTLVCELRDYRKSATEVGSKTNSGDVGPIVNKVLLRMSLENVVKDMPSISDDSWTYGDLMEVESRVLKALRPQLCLDPTPNFQQLSSHPCENKLNLGISRYKRKLQSAMEVTIELNSQMRGKKVCIETMIDNHNSDLNAIGIKSGNALTQHPNGTRVPLPVSNMQPKAQEACAQALELTNQSLYQSSDSSMRTNQIEVPVGYGIQGSNAQVQHGPHVVGPLSDSLGSNSHNGKRDGQDMQAINNKKTKLIQTGQDSNRQLVSPRVEGPAVAEMHWKNAQLQQQLDVKNVSSVAYPSNIPNQKYPLSNSESGSFYLNNLENRIIKQEQGELEKLQEFEKLRMNLQATDGGNNQLNQPQLQQMHPAHHLASNFQQQQWNTIGSPAEKDIWKKAAQHPQFSSGTSVHSPVSSQSVEVSLGSQKEKVMNHGNSMQKNPGKKKGSVSNTLMSGVASPASVGNVSTPITANSPVVPPTSMATTEPILLERFSKLNLISQRYQLHNKRNKMESFNTIKPKIHSSNEITSCLANINADDEIDLDRPMSRSIIGGSMSKCKTRTLSCARSSTYQGSVLYRFKTRLIMSECPADGSVVMRNVYLDEFDVPSQDCMLTLPNTVYADLLSAQFCMLMAREGYQILEDHTLSLAAEMNTACISFAAGVIGNSTVPEGQQADGLPGQQSNAASLGSNSSMGGLNSPQTVSNNTRMVSGNAHAAHMPQGFLPTGQTPVVTRAQQFEQNQQVLLQQQQNQSSQQMLTQLQQQMQPQLPQQQQQVVNQQQQSQQQQHPQMQRSSVLQMNHLSQLIGQNSNMQMGGNQMINKPTHLQLQALQQQTPQQQAQFARKGIMGLGGVSVSNAMMGLTNFSSVIGGARGMSSPVGAIPGFSNINQNQINLGPSANYNVGFRPGSMPHAAALRLRMTAPTQARGNLFGSQSGIAGMPGNSGQLLSNPMGLAMMGQLNRPSIPMQRQTMGPPKISGNNGYMNPQQLQQQQLQQQQVEQQQDQQLLQHQQQQQINSPLQQPQQQQQAGSPSVMGSPASMQMQQQQLTSIQMNQQTPISPQQLSTGALPQVNNASLAVAGPGSPQLSSQTHGSVGSISSSPMEQLQGTNKGS